MRRLVAILPLICSLCFAVESLGEVPQLRYERYRFSTLAGSPPSAGLEDGTGSAARFAFPVAIAADAAGSLYVTQSRAALRKIDATADVTTIVQTIIHVTSDGVIYSAPFKDGRGVAVGRSGDLFVADNFEHTIIRISPGGTVSTFAGAAGQPNGFDGDRTAARFYRPAGMSSDGAGNLYVADSGNNAIRRITPEGFVTTLAGGNAGSSDGIGRAAQFRSPLGVAVDTAGNVYVSDTGNATIRKVTPDGVVTTLAGLAGAPGNVDATGSSARFQRPTSLAVNSAGELFVTDAQAIRKVTPGGVVTTVAGAQGASGYIDGPGVSARFADPLGIIADKSGNLYVTDATNNLIRKLTPDGTVSTFAGANFPPSSVDGTGSAARFQSVAGIVADGSRNTYVGDSGVVRKITPAGTVSTLFSSSPVSAVFVIDAAGTIYGTYRDSIVKRTSDGTVVTIAGSPNSPGRSDGPGPIARFDAPAGLTVTSDGTVYVTEYHNYTVRKITPDGVVSTLAGAAGFSGSVDGVGLAARFLAPTGIAVDTAGALFVNDFNAIRKITADGTVTTFAGSNTQAGNVDGAGSAVRFSGTGGLAFDKQGNLYVAGGASNTIRKVTPNAVVTSIAGTPLGGGSTDGVGSAARFNFPDGIAVDAAGVVYVADYNNKTVRISGPTSISQSLNISTRVHVGTGDDVLVGGFIATGHAGKQILLRAMGPSLASFGLPDALVDPVLELHDSSGNIIGTNDNWGDSQRQEIEATGLAPANLRESALLANLYAPASYTVVVRGKNNTSGSALVEVYDLDPQADLLLANISTRGLVDTGDNVMIGGFILGGAPGRPNVLVRAMGPSLSQSGINNTLADPTLELHDGNGAVLAANDNWKQTQQAAIEATGLAPSNDLESAILAALPPGNYTAIVAGKNGGTGVGLVEVYNLD